MAIFSAGFIILSSYYRYYVAYWFSYGALHIALIFVLAQNALASEEIAAFAIILQHVVLFVDFAWKKQLEVMKSILQFVSFVIMEFWLATGLLLESPILNRVVLVYCIIGYIAAYWWVWKQSEKEQQDVAVKVSARMITSMVLVSLAVIILIQDIAQFSLGITLVFIEAVFFIIIGLKLRSTAQWIIGTIIAGFTGLVIPTQVPDKIISVETLGWIVLLIAIPMLYRSIVSYQGKEKPSVEARVLLWVEAFLGLMFASIMISLLTESASNEFKHLAMSVVWLLYAIGAIVLGIVYKIPKARLTGIIFLFVVLIKVILVDVPDTSLTIKAVLFIALGLVGLIVSRILYGKKDETQENIGINPQQHSQEDSTSSNSN